MSNNRAHARLSASGAYIWLNCTMSPRLSKGLERKSSKWADEGTKAHWVAESMLQGQGTLDLDEHATMQKWVKPYVDYVTALVKTSPFHAIEKRVSLAPLWELEGENPPEDMFGTADFVCLTPDPRTLHVVDLKYGAGVAVEVKDNSQLMYYALAVLLSLPPELLQPEVIRMTVVQPRCAHPDGPVRHWDIPTVDLLDWGHSILKPTVELIANDDVKYLSVVEGKHCRWCPAASGQCPEKHKTKTAQAQQEFEAIGD